MNEHWDVVIAWDVIFVCRKMHTFSSLCRKMHYQASWNVLALALALKIGFVFHLFQWCWHFVLVTWVRARIDIKKTFSFVIVHNKFKWLFYFQSAKERKKIVLFYCWNELDANSPCHSMKTILSEFLENVLHFDKWKSVKWRERINFV